MPTDPTIRRLRHAYEPLWPVGLHVATRLRTCPIREVVNTLPSEGCLLDIGCGHGIVSLLAALSRPRLRVVGLDLDERKIAAARAASDRLGTSDRVEFAVGDATATLPAADVSAVVCVDVLYLLGESAAAEATRTMSSVVGPGGVVVIKEMGELPRWKARWNQVQEFTALRVFRYTLGTTVGAIPASQIRSALEHSGLDVEETPLDHHRVHPHRLFVGRVPIRANYSGGQRAGG